MIQINLILFLGAPELVQTAAELTAYIGPDVLKKLLSSGKHKEIIDAARTLGLTDEQITPVLQSETKLKWLSKLTPRRGSTQKALENTKDDSFRVELGQDKAETLLSLVQSNGYKDMDAYRFAISLTPILTPDDISKLAKYKVTSPDTFKSVVDRIRAVKYEKEDVNPSIELIFQFLSDENQASKTNGSTATVIKKEREKEAQIEKERLAEAQRIRNQPLSKATLDSKLEYIYYQDGRCTEDTGQRCLNVNQYKQICDFSINFTKKIRSDLAVIYKGDYSEFLETGATLANIKYGWNGKMCVISFNVTGTFKGTTHDKKFIGVIRSFKVTNSKEVLIHGAFFQ